MNNAAGGRSAASNSDDSLTPAQPGPLQRLRSQIPHLKKETLGKAAQYIVHHPGDVGGASIGALAKSAGVSASTISRLAAHLGYSGYPAMRADIATDVGREVQAGWLSDIGDQISMESGPLDILKVLSAHQHRAARSALESLDLAAANEAAELISGARRIHLHGEWADSVSLKEFYLRLLRLDLPVWLHEGNLESQVVAGLMGPDDVALVLSRSGGDPVGLTFCHRAAENEAHTIAITGDPDSPLIRAADIGLFTGTREGHSWTDFFGGRASDTLTMSLLWVLVAQRVPGGLGKTPRLFDDESNTLE